MATQTSDNDSAVVANAPERARGASCSGRAPARRVTRADALLMVVFGWAMRLAWSAQAQVRVLDAELMDARPVLDGGGVGQTTQRSH